MPMEPMNARVSHRVNGTAFGHWRRGIAKPRLRTSSESRRRPFAFTWTMSSISSDARPARRPPLCWASLGCWAQSAPDPALRSRSGLVTAFPCAGGPQSWYTHSYIVSDLVDGLPTLGQDIGKDRPDMNHLLPDVELNLHACGLGFGREPGGVVEQCFVRADHDQQWRQPTKI